MTGFWTISKQAGLLIAVPLVFEMIFVGVLYNTFNQAEQELKQEMKARHSISRANALMGSLVQTMAGVGHYGISKDKSSLKRYKFGSKKVRKELIELERLAEGDKQKQKSIRRLRKLTELVSEQYAKVIANVRGEDVVTAALEFQKSRKILGKLLDELDNAIVEERRLEQIGHEKQIRAREMVRGVMLLGVFINVFLAVFLTALFARYTSRRLNIVVDNTNRLATGQKLLPRVSGKDEITLLDEEFRRMSRLIMEAAERERAVTENAVDVICTLDSSMKIESASPSAEQLWGYKSSELIGMRLSKLIVEEELERVREYLEGLREEKNKGTIETRVATKDEGVADFIWSVNWSLEKQSWFCIAHDVTKRKLAEQLLRESEAKTRLILETIPIGIIITTKEGSIELTNQAAKRLFEKQDPDLIGASISEQFEDTEPVPEWLGDGAPLEGLTAIRGTGGTFPAQVQSELFNTTDGERCLVMVNDLTQKYELERLKQQFTSMISHDIKTPLTYLQFMMELALRGRYGELSGDGEKEFKAALNNTERVISLIDDLLMVDKLETGNFNLAVENVSIGDIIEPSIKVVEHLAKKQEMEIESNYEAFELDCDSDRMIQVISNLLTNAIKHSESRSSILVTAACNDGEAEIKVRDSGQGIALEMQEKIFDRFVRTQSSNLKDTKGAGLGLAICKAIVKAHGGEIGVDSEPGKGSTFWLKLPRA